ncbi:MAG: hypothetical protein ACYTGZ_08145 [Planctomycetota bacterium]|jgi:hypothetical protein
MNNSIGGGGRVRSGWGGAFVLLVLVAGCESQRMMGHRDDPANQAEWSAIVMCPDANRRENTRWYLDKIEWLANNTSGVHAPSATEKARILAAVTLRRNTLHPAHTVELSWIRIQSAFWHATDKTWGGAIHMLQEVPGATAPATWLNFQGADPDPNCDTPAMELLDTIPNNLVAGSHITFGSGAYSDIVWHVSKRKGTAWGATITPPHSTESLWTQAYLCNAYSRTPKAPDPPGGHVIMWTICELTFDG